VTYTKQSFAALVLLAWAAALVLMVNYLDMEYSGHKPEVMDIKLDSFVVIETLPLPHVHYRRPTTPPPDKDAIEIVSHDVIFISERERTCLIRNVFYESSGEPYLGKIAVAQVTWNRVKHGKWGRDICSVVYAPGQFSWTVDPNKRNSRIGGKGWEDTIQAVEDFVNGTRIVRLENSLFFHASYVKPNWHRWADRIKQIGNHIFYALK
jgi:spore germination cell wall hydrolase CwlJ-like protein